MPFGPGTYAGEGGAGLAGPATQRQGIPQGGIMPSGAPDEAAMSELLAMLRGGQVGAERFLQLLSLLAASTAPQMAQAPGAPPVPMGGQGPAPAPGGAPPGGPGGMDLAALLGS